MSRVPLSVGPSSGRVSDRPTDLHRRVPKACVRRRRSTKPPTPRRAGRYLPGVVRRPDNHPTTTPAKLTTKACLEAFPISHPTDGTKHHHHATSTSGSPNRGQEDATPATSRGPAGTRDLASLATGSRPTVHAVIPNVTYPGYSIVTTNLQQISQPGRQVVDTSAEAKAASSTQA